MKWSIYPPSDDTYFLLDNLPHNLGDSIAEVGCGSGVVSLQVAKKTKRVLATDINFHAVKRLWEKAKMRKIDTKIDVICCDLLSCLRNLRSFSSIIFNPPYLPCEWIEDPSVCGGENGVEIVIKFIDLVNRLKYPGLKIFIVLSNRANIKKVNEALENNRIKFRVIATKSLGFFEELRLYLLTL